MNQDTILFSLTEREKRLPFFFEDTSALYFLFSIEITLALLYGYFHPEYSSLFYLLQ